MASFSVQVKVMSMGSPVPPASRFHTPRDTGRLHVEEESTGFAKSTLLSEHWLPTSKEIPVMLPIMSPFLLQRVWVALCPFGQSTLPKSQPVGWGVGCQTSVQVGQTQIHGPPTVPLVLSGDLQRKSPLVSLGGSGSLFSKRVPQWHPLGAWLKW